MSSFKTIPYQPPFYCRGAHAETIVPNIVRRRLAVAYKRFRLELSDGDFVDLDCSPVQGKGYSDTCVLSLHGLEGSATAPYVKSLVRAANTRGLDVVAMNMRGCSGSMNRKARFYHSGETGDLHETVLYLSARYKRIALVGFSLGGNVVLKYVGEQGEGIQSYVSAAVGISAPVDLAASAKLISAPANGFYMRRFIRLLSKKIELKAQMYPEIVDARGCRNIKTFLDFDGAYTAPLNGFSSAEEYWSLSSALKYMPNVRIPTLLVNARNDPFLSGSCFPVELMEENENLYSLYPDSGGHMGFPSKRVDGACWHERVGLDFLERFGC